MNNCWNTPRIVFLEEHVDERGVLDVVECLPFKAQRAFWIRNVPDGATRGGHAHRECQEFLVSLVGECFVLVRGPKMNYHYRLDTPLKGLYIPPMWTPTMTHFSEDCVLLALASHKYDPGDQYS